MLILLVNSADPRDRLTHTIVEYVIAIALYKVLE
jgi:hypothetical protein